jgi:hypothetical protein
MTSPLARKPRRRLGHGLIAVGVTLLLVCLAAWTFAPALFAGPTATIRWQLAPLGAGIDRTASVVPVYLDQWPDEACSRGRDWLAAPLVTETPWSVTITMRTASAFAGCDGWYDFWGTPIEIPLMAPLGGRAIFDGSTIPASPR